MKKDQLIKWLLIFFGAIFTLQGCKYEKYAAGNFPDTYITFGSYRPGGDEDKKVLMPNGMLFGHQIGDTRYTLLNEIPRSDARALIQEVVDTGIKTKRINNESKLSYFLVYVEDGKEYRWVWGESITGIPEEVAEIMPKLYALVPKPENP